MAVETLLARLDHVRKTGRAQWVACCPAHESKSRQSLSIAESADGRVLVHDFGGCSALAVLEAIGLDFVDLFPRDPDDAGRPNGWRGARAKDARQRIEQLHPRTALTAILADVTEAAVIVSGVAEGRTDAERVRLELWTLAGRIASALSMAGVRLGC